MFHNAPKASTVEVRVAGLLFSAAMCAVIMLCTVAAPAGYETRARAGDPPKCVSADLIAGVPADTLPTIVVLGRTQG